MNKRLKKERGITLVALAVTMIVLVIIAGVVVSLVFENESVIENANKAVKQYSETETNDVNAILEYDNIINSYAEGSSGEDSSEEIAYLESLFEDKTADDLFENGYYNESIQCLDYGEDYDLIEYNGGYYKVIYDVNTWEVIGVETYTPKDKSELTAIEILEGYFNSHVYNVTLPDSFDDDPQWIPDASTTMIPVRLEGSGIGAKLYFTYKGNDYYVTYGRDDRIVREVE